MRGIQNHFSLSMQAVERWQIKVSHLYVKGNVEFIWNLSGALKLPLAALGTRQNSRKMLF